MKKVILILFTFIFTDLAFSIGNGLEEKMFQAVSHNDKAAIEQLLKEGIGINTKVRDTPPLSLAIEKRNVELVKYFLDKKAKVNIKDFSENAPLHIACYLCTDTKQQEEALCEIVKLLLNHGANVNIKGGIEAYGESFFSRGKKKELTPLHYACNSGRFETVKILVEHGADVNAKDYEGNTPLHFATDHGSPELIEYLLLKSADVNAKSKSNPTSPMPIFSAVAREDIKMIGILISHNADIKLKNYNNETPYDFAVRTGRKKVAEFLKKVEEEQLKNEKK